MKKGFIVIFIAVLFVSCIVLDSRAAYTSTNEKEISRKILINELANEKLPAKKRVDLLIAKMTIEEKILMLSGYKDFYVAPIERLGLRPLRMADATMGLRGIGRATAFPSAICMAATWDQDAVYSVGEAIAQECRAKGIDILLAPGINIYRVPTCSRNFEYFGEDPYLVSQLVVPYIKGIQDNKVMATVKHFAANNSEFDRHRMNSVVDERTLHEIYFPGFKAAVQVAHTKGLMMAYNPINGISASENGYLMRDILREKWGYDGVIMSDWISVYNTLDPIKAGLNLEMPSDSYLNEKGIKKLIADGQISESEIDEMVFYILLPAFQLGLYDRAPVDNSFLEYGGEHDKVALNIVEQGAVLLKNESEFLPLNKKKDKKLVIIGHNSKKTATSGGGAGKVTPYDSISIVRGVKELIKDVSITTSFNRKNIKNADAVIVCIGLDSWHEMESHERPWELPSSQIRLVDKVASLNPNTIVSITAGGGIETESWIGDVKAVLHSFYGGQSVGTAVAKIIYGDVNPSGKLPMTMSKKWDDFSTTSEDRFVKKNRIKWSIWPIINLKLPLFGSKVLRKIWDVEYKEGIMVGYRHFDSQKITPQFAFGHGLSYTNFEIENVSLSSTSIDKNENLYVKATVSNSGLVAGAEVVQCYVRDNKASVVRPDKELKGFKKIFLEPGETKEISIELDFNSFSFYDVNISDWKVESGEFTILVGNSSDNIVASLPLIVK